MQIFENIQICDIHIHTYKAGDPYVHTYVHTYVHLVLRFGRFVRLRVGGLRVQARSGH